jgi:DNA-binding transcriptional LysR family regulator
MDVQKARYLIALAEHGSFSRAAIAVGLTQPAFSRSIQSLEHELGVRLVDRRGRRIQLTPAGQLTAERGRRVLKELSEAHRALARLVQGETGLVRIGAAPLPSARLLGRFLRETTAQRPEVQVLVDVASTSTLVGLLREERIDVLVGDGRDVPLADDLVVDRVAPWGASFLVRAGHPVLDGRPASLARLRRWPIAGPDLGPAGAGLVTIVSNDLGMLVELARSGETVIVADPDGLAPRIAAGELVRLDVPDAGPIGGTTVLARLAWRTLPAAVEELYRIARADAARA